MERRNFLTGAIATLFSGLFGGTQQTKHLTSNVRSISGFGYGTRLKPVDVRWDYIKNVWTVHKQSSVLLSSCDNPNAIDHSLSFTFITNNNGNIEELV